LELKPILEGTLFKKIQILEDDPELRFIKEYLLADFPGGYLLKSAFYVHNETLEDSFEFHLGVMANEMRMGKESKDPLSVPKWSQDCKDEEERELRTKV